MDASERIVTLSVTREVCEKYMAPMDAILKMEGEPEGYVIEWKRRAEIK